jgi:hypothetical protein
MADEMAISVLPRITMSDVLSHTCYDGVPVDGLSVLDFCNLSCRPCQKVTVLCHVLPHQLVLNVVSLAVKRVESIGPACSPVSGWFLDACDRLEKYKQSADWREASYAFHACAVVAAGLEQADNIAREQEGAFQLADFVAEITSADSAVKPC